MGTLTKENGFSSWSPWKIEFFGIEISPCQIRCWTSRQKRWKIGLQQLRIDREYFVCIPREPNETELIASRQCLARMIGVPVIDDNGLYSILDDQYHSLMVGPVPESELTAWEEHSWIRMIGCTTPDWICCCLLLRLIFFRC